MKEILIIPDVHGRSFWKEAVRRYPDSDTIFLGDYHDPYPRDGISEGQSLSNLMELMEYTAEHSDCHLLLGNHDLHYLCNTGEACRLDYDNYDAVRHILLDNLPRMAIATTRDIGGRTVLFSHAPILSGWIKAVGETDHLSTLIEHLNGLLETINTDPKGIETMLGHISPCRGGYDKVGSPVWADMREIAGDNTVPPTADYSIFGHTQLLQASITPRWADLDCRKAFILTPNLKLIKV